MTVTNSAVTANSQIFIQVEDGNAVGNLAALTTSINTLGAGTYLLNIENNSANPTVLAPQYHYLIINPL